MMQNNAFGFSKISLVSYAHDINETVEGGCNNYV